MEKIYLQKQLNELLDIIQYNFQLAPYRIPYSRSMESWLTGAKRSIMKGTASDFYTNGMKTDASNGRGPKKKQNRYRNSSPSDL